MYWTNHKMEYMIRLIIIAIVCSIVFSDNNVNFTFFIVCILIFILNVQVRLISLNGITYLLSLLFDIFIVGYISYTFGVFTLILAGISIYDASSKKGIEGIIITIIAFGTCSYFIGLENFEFILLTLTIVIIIAAFARENMGLRMTIMEMESLYDDNRRYSYKLEDAKIRLEEYSKRVENISQLEERNRLSKEIHDTIGHKLTGVLMQIQAAIKISEKDQKQGMELMVLVGENMRSCINILRQTVRDIKPKNYSNRIISIKEMITDFKKNTGIEISFDIKGEPVKLFPSAEVAIYKNIQEALTNSIRHGKATNISILIEFIDNQVILTVADNGVGCDKITKGIGISGMEERTIILGGWIEICSQNGFIVKSIVPIK